MYFLRNLLGILAVVGGLAVTVWIGRYSSFGKSAPQLQATNGAIQKTPTEPAKKDDKAAVPEHRKHPSADTPAAAPEVVSPESLLSNGLRTA
jgi:hypothetical protein